MSNLEQNTSVTKTQEGYITQISEEKEGGLTRNLSKDFSKMKNCVQSAFPWRAKIFWTQYSKATPDLLWRHHETRLI